MFQIHAEIVLLQVHLNNLHLKKTHHIQHTPAEAPLADFVLVYLTALLMCPVFMNTPLSHVMKTAELSPGLKVNLHVWRPLVILRPH